MPTVSVYEDEIKAALGAEMTEKLFMDLCFQFGLELDEVTSEYEMYRKERGDGFNELEASKKSKRTVYKVEVPANRYDLLCYEGLISALKIFKKVDSVPVYSVVSPSRHHLTVRPSVYPLRPFVVCAILRDISFTEASYQSFIELQDKLHQNLCRKRTLVAIGTHDLDTIEGPFTYEAVTPENIVFTPLNQSKAVNGFEMMHLLSQHQQLKAYLPIIASSPVFPVIRDSKGVVLSVPPIINGDHSKITLKTRNVFIECTATDLTKATVTLNTVVAMFSRYCAVPFSAEPVRVMYAQEHGYPSVAGKSFEYPDMSERVMMVSTKTLSSCINPERPISEDSLVDMLGRMGLTASVDHKALDQIRVGIPVTRSDVMHTCDLIEDVCVAYGFNNVVPETAKTLGRPREQPINQLSDLIRLEMAMAGFTESLTWGLVSVKENFDFLRRPVPKIGAQGAPVRLSNPKTKEFEIVRTSLFPGLLKTLAANKHNRPPMRLFEVSDIVTAEPLHESGAINTRKLAAVFCGISSGFEVIHGLLDQLMWALDCSSESGGVQKRRKAVYRLVPNDDPMFFPGRQASVELNGVPIGVIGVVHPEVLGAYDIPFAVSGLELNVECFLDMLAL